MEIEKVIDGEKYIIKVVTGDPSDTLTENDKEMDYRARKAVEMAIEKAKICKKPIARYDAETKHAYLEYPNGEREYVK
ncbi:MAG: hypothetical protein KH026_11685 [Clostridium sp.]|nr:hypothetical protein [Clostridium sp.]